MITLLKQSHRLLAMLIAALFAAGPVLAERGDKADKHAEKQAQKAEKHAEKRAEKADKRAGKDAEKADKRAGKHAEMAWDDGDKERKHARKRDQHERQDVRIGAYFDDRHRQVTRTYYTQHYGNARNCPPGLAKKNNGCMPPGQARKLAVGQPLPAGVVVYAVPQPVLVQLPPPPYGYRYARVGNDIVLVQAQNNLVVDIIVNIFG
jgi:Ni/Co efflux regulator RcnB